MRGRRRDYAGDRATVIHYVVPRKRAFTFQYYLEDWAGSAANRFRIVAAEDFIRSRSLDAGTYVYAVDDIEPAERSVLAAIWRQLEAAAPRALVLNDPVRTLGRLEFLSAMTSAGRNAFRAVTAREWPAPLRFPVFIRDRELHGGALTPLLRSASDVTRLLRWFVWKGYRREDLLVVEFCETADREGLYRKYSAYIVGDRIIPRCIEFGSRWMVKHDSRTFTDARIQEEHEYVTANPHESWLREVFALANITYGRADYALKDGAPQVFEINLNPTVGRYRPRNEDSEDTLRVRERRRPTNETFYAAFNAAWAALDPHTAPPGSIAIAIDPALAAEARRQRRQKLQRNRRRAFIGGLTSNAAVAGAVRMLRRLYLGKASA